MQDMKTDLLLEAFDSFLSDINTALASKSFFEEENRALKAEAEHLNIDAKRRDEMIASKNDEIARLLEKSSIVARAQNSKAMDVKSEIRATAELVEMKYEVEILLSNQRAHNRELAAQRTENESLLRSNQQLSRELSVAKLHSSELERGTVALRSQLASEANEQGKSGGGRGGRAMFYGEKAPMAFSSSHKK